MKKLKLFFAACALLLGVSNASAKTDVTSTYLTNAGLISLEGWTIDKGFGGNGYTDWKTDGDVPVIEFYHTWSAKAGDPIGTTKTFNFSQVANLPAGYYRLAVNAFYREGNGNGTNTKAYIYAGEQQQYVYGLSAAGVGGYSGANDLYKAANAFSKGDFSNEFDFQVTEAGEVEIGFHGYIDTYCSWCILGPVTLWEYTVEDYYADYDEKYEIAEGLLTNPMNVDVKSALQEAMVDKATLTTVDEAKAAINKLGTAITDAQSSVNAYASANVEAYLTKMKGVLDNTNVYTTDAYNKWYANVQSNFENGLYTDGEVATLTESGAYSTGWHASNRIDDVLLSTWSIDGVPCGDYTLPLYINTWSTEGNTDGSEFFTPFFEYWTGDAKSLDAKDLVSTITGLKANETYSFTIRARVRQTDGKTKIANGITMQVGSGDAVDISAGAIFGTGPFFIGNFSAVGQTDADGKLTTTITVAENSNISWLSFYNCKYTEGEDLSAYIADYEFALNNVNTALTTDVAYESMQGDLKAAATTYANVDESNKAALIAAKEALETALADYNAIVSPLKGNNIDGWETTSNNGKFEVNTWSSEGNTDGSGMTTPFTQNWIGKGTSLTDATMKYTVEGLTPGYYKVTALIRSLNEAGGATPKGSFIFANDNIERAYNGTACTNGVYDNPIVYGLVGDDGKLTFGVKIIKANVNWVSWKNFVYEYVGTELTSAIANNQTEEARTFEYNTSAQTAENEAVSALSVLSDDNYVAAGVAIENAYKAVDRDFTALQAAIDAKESAVLGFEAGEYAPYNLSAPLAAAKAIDQNSEASTQEEINTATTNLNNVSANADEVNAIYDGSFAYEYSHEGNVKPIGWIGGTGHDNATDVRYMWNAEANPGLNATTNHTALFTKYDAYYGKTEGYTMPLKSNTVYKLTFKYGTWGTSDDQTKGDAYLQMEDGNGNAVTVYPSSLALTKEQRGANADAAKWYDFTGYFTTEAAGNYVLDLLKTTTNQQNQYVYGDFELVKAPATVSVDVTDAGYATYVNSDYALNFTNSDIKAYKVKVNEKGVATMTKVDKVPAGTPVLLYKEDGATENIPVIASADAVSENDLVAGTGAAVATEDGGGYTNMILNNVGGNVGFYFAAGQTVATNRAYLHILTTLAPDAENGARMVMRFAGEITGINEAAASAEAALKDGKYVEAGKVVIYRNGKKFNATGAQMK